MLFDLKGKRRRVVQVVYLTLAVLMGGGLVLFGIGGDVSGGLFDAFSDRGGGDNSNQGEENVKKDLEKAEKQLQANPKNEAALKIVVRKNYQLAQADSNEQTGAFGAEGKKQLEASAAAWKRYLALEPKTVDASLLSTVLQVYVGLNQPAEAAKAVELVAAQEERPELYLQMVQLWTQAGDARRADLAGKKAVSLVPKEQRKQAEQEVAQAKQAAAQAGDAQDQAADPGGVPAQ